MSLKAFGILPRISSHYILLRRENEGQSDYMSQCLASAGGSAHIIKTCELMDKAMEEKAGDIFNCVRKCKDNACQETCVYSVLGVDLDAMLDSPYADASIGCTKGKDTVISCTSSCKRTDMKCNIQCFDDHKFDNVSCISKKLEVSEDQVKEMIDCPQTKCVDSNDMAKHFECIAECQKTSQDSNSQDEKNDTNNKDGTSKNKDGESGSSDSKSKQSNQSSSSSSKSSSDDLKSSNESASLRLTNSNLITLGLVLVSLSFNIQ